MTPTEVRFSGCVARYTEGTVSVISDRDPTDRFVWTLADAEAAARVFRFLAPELAKALRALASAGRVARTHDRRDAE